MGKCVSDVKDVAECINSYFASIVETLGILSEVIVYYEKSSPSPVGDTIKWYASHQSIKKISEV